MRLPRPNIPLKVKLAVLLRQYGKIDPQECGDAQQFLRHAEKNGALGYYVKSLKKLLAASLKCDIRDLRLDHDPALENRAVILKNRRVYPVQKISRTEYDQIVRYVPDANAPAFLRYIPHRDHHIKTNVRGDGAQFSDNTLAKRERNRQRKLRKPTSRYGKIPRRRNPWPPKGSRPFWKAVRR